MGRLIDPKITRGTVHGTCPKCREPFMGEMDADHQSVDLKCVGCGHEGAYFYRWPDELPSVTLRHRSNGRVLGAKNRKVKARNKKANPDQVLKGQLSFSAVELRPDPNMVYKFSVGSDGSGGSMGPQ